MSNNNDTVNTYAYITLKKRSLNPNDTALTWQEMNDNLSIIESHINEPIPIVNQEQFDILCSSDQKFFVQFENRLYYKSGLGQAVGLVPESDLSNYILCTLMGAPNGVATLDSEKNLVQSTDCGEF